MTPREIIGRLRALVKGMVSARVNNKVRLRAWLKENEAYVAECLAYERKEGMPPTTSLVSAHFHPDLPLVGLNYTGVAHNTLYAFPEGWTLPLRYCRGIVFDRRGTLVAWPFEKFFNYGEHPDSMNIPEGPITATEKHDGHLGIIFRYRERFIITTRGTFTHQSAAVGQKMLDELARQYNWFKMYPEQMTLLVEIIHPETKVHLDYGDVEQLMLIGARHHRGDFYDCEHRALELLSDILGMPCASQMQFPSLGALANYVADNSVVTREGLVAAYRDGPFLRRVKFKFHGYLGLMFNAKMSFKYVLQRIMNDDLDDRLSMMSEENRIKAQKWVAQAMDVCNWPGAQKERWTRLYKLLPEDQDTPYARQICRSYVKWLDEQKNN